MFGGKGPDVQRGSGTEGEGDGDGGSRELEDAPRWAAGTSATVRLTESIYLTADYEGGRFGEGFAEDDQEQEIRRFSALLVIEF